MDTDFSEIEAYWRDPTPFDAARVEGQARIDALFVPHEARVKAQMEARWASEVGA
jgi:hypothetical protein